MTCSYSDLTEASDAKLVVESLQGDLSAYDEIVRRYQQVIAGSLYRFCANKADLEDLVQETFIRAFNKLAKWSPKASLLSWIRRIGYNISYDYLRKQKRNPLANLIQTKHEYDGVNEAVELNIVDESTRADQLSSNNDLVQWLLGQLSADEAMVISMLYLDQLSVQEIADRTGWGISKIKVKTHRTRKKLKAIFESHERIKLQYSATI